MHNDTALQTPECTTATDARHEVLEALLEHFRTASAIAEKRAETSNDGDYQQGMADAYEEAERLCLTIIAMTRNNRKAT